MILTISILISLLALFYLLGKSADLVIYNLRIIAEKLGVKVFFLGLILGVFTSLPEFLVGINAVIDNISTIAVGNLSGGIIVLFSLILGVGIILNRKIVSTEKITTFGLIFGYLILPLFLGLNGNLSFWKGLLLVILYPFLIFYLYQKQKHHNFSKGSTIINSEKLLKNIFLMILGVALMIVISDLIVSITESLLSQWLISPFVVGLVLFSLGTNLPEIIVMIRSWRRNLKELSISNLIGSGMSNILILGFLVMLKPVFIDIDASYYILLFFMVCLFATVLFFYKTGKNLSRQEGFALLGIYLLFIISQLTFVFFDQLKI